MIEFLLENIDTAVRYFIVYCIINFIWGVVKFPKFMTSKSYQHLKKDGRYETKYRTVPVNPYNWFGWSHAIIVFPIGLLFVGFIFTVSYLITNFFRLCKKYIELGLKDETRYIS